MGLLVTFAVACLVTVAVIEYRRHQTKPPTVPIRKPVLTPPTKDEIHTFIWDLHHRADFIERFR